MSVLELAELAEDAGGAFLLLLRHTRGVHTYVSAKGCFKRPAWLWTDCWSVRDSCKPVVLDILMTLIGKEIVSDPLIRKVDITVRYSHKIDFSHADRRAGWYRHGQRAWCHRGQQSSSLYC